MAYAARPSPKRLAHGRSVAGMTGRLEPDSSAREKPDNAVFPAGKPGSCVAATTESRPREIDGNTPSARPASACPTARRGADCVKSRPSTSASRTSPADAAEPPGLGMADPATGALKGRRSAYATPEIREPDSAIPNPERPDAKRSAIGANGPGTPVAIVSTSRTSDSNARFGCEPATVEPDCATSDTVGADPGGAEALGAGRLRPGTPAAAGPDLGRPGDAGPSAGWFSKAVLGGGITVSGEPDVTAAPPEGGAAGSLEAADAGYEGRGPDAGGSDRLWLRPDMPVAASLDRAIGASAKSWRSRDPSCAPGIGAGIGAAGIGIPGIMSGITSMAGTPSPGMIATSRRTAGRRSSFETLAAFAGRASDPATGRPCNGGPGKTGTFAGSGRTASATVPDASGTMTGSAVAPRANCKT